MGCKLSTETHVNDLSDLEELELHGNLPYRIKIKAYIIYPYSKFIEEDGDEYELEFVPNEPSKIKIIKLTNY